MKLVGGEKVFVRVDARGADAVWGLIRSLARLGMSWRKCSGEKHENGEGKLWMHGVIVAGAGWVLSRETGLNVRGWFCVQYTRARACAKGLPEGLGRMDAIT